jgi:hypothetical protein
MARATATTLTQAEAAIAAAQHRGWRGSMRAMAYGVGVPHRHWLLSVVLVLACGGGQTLKPGSCAAPARVTLPFTAPPDATTVGLGDVGALCAPAAESLPEAVYGIALGSARPVRVIASDSSGQGIGVAIQFGAGCFSATQACLRRTSGGFDEMTPSLQPGEYTVVVERNPPGSFTLTLE